MLLTCIISYLCVCGVFADFNLTILHTNDVHARFEQTNKYSAACSEKDQEEDKCFGGYARIIGKVKDLKQKYPNSIVLDGGDQFQGTTWFYKYGGNVTAHFMNLLGYDAMAIGNHEFDRKIDGLVPFIDQANFPVLSSNIDTTKEPTIEGKLKKSTILDVGGEKIAVVGYTTTDTPSISNSGGLMFKDEILSIREEIQSIKSTNPNINKFVALGHSGFQKDQEIGEQIDDIDIVVGGHTNTFLYTGTPPSNENPRGDYPFVVTKPNGKKALCVQDYAYGKYLGFLNVIFDNQGDLKAWNGNPILLDKTIPRDTSVLKELKPWKADIDEFKKTKAGETRVYLEGDSLVCRRGECNLGNAILDGMLRYNLNNKGTNNWNNVSIVIMNSGGIRAPIDQGIITFDDVLTSLPFRNTISLMDLKGEVLLDALEHSVSTLTTDESNDLKGQFLQISGLRVKYNLNKPSGKRVIDVKVLCTECKIPIFEKLDENKYYRVVAPDFVGGGGDGYDMIKNKKMNYLDKGDVDNAVFNDYLQKYSPIIQGLDGRIEFVSDEEECPTSGTRHFRPSFLVLFFIVCIYCCPH